MGSSSVPMSAYPTAEQVMNRARAFVNDAFRGGAGRILTDSAPFSIEYLNSALEELQDKIGNNGVITLIKDNVILGPIPPLPAPDPAAEVYISYTGLYTGYEQIALPVLPSDLVSIEECYERVVGSGLPFKPMTQPMAGLPSILQGPWLNLWEYRTDRLYFTGSTQTEEVRIRYQARFAPLTDGNFSDTSIQILASVNAMATLVAYNYARARGAAQAQIMAADALKMMRYIVRRYTRRAQGVPYNRSGYGESGDRRSTWLPL